MRIPNPLIVDNKKGVLIQRLLLTDTVDTQARKLGVNLPISKSFRNKGRRLLADRNLWAARLLALVTDQKPPGPDDEEIKRRPSLTLMDTIYSWQGWALDCYVYPFECRCGSTVLLSAAEALGRDRLGLGCGRPQCSATGLDVQIWHNPLTSMCFQIAQLCALFPEGKVAKGPHQMFKLARSVLAIPGLQDSVSRLEFWLQDIDPSLPLVHHGTAVSGLPDTALFPGGQTHVNFGNELMTTSEFCDVVGADYDRFMRLRQRVCGSELIDQAIGDTDEHV